jgi:WS/DGAT/MGAT family acyltransferase
MSPVDTAWLRMDRAVNRMVIVGVMKLRGPVDMDRLARTLSVRLLAYPRFHQRVETGSTGSWWVDDAHFDIARHIKRVRLPGAGGKVELEAFVAELCSQPLDPAHPLWQFHIIEDYEGGVALVPRFHHALADGMALVAVLLSMTDETPNAPLHGGDADFGQDRDAHGHGLFAPMAKALDRGVQASGELWRLALKLLARPGSAAKLLQGGVGVASELAYLLLMPSDSQTRFKGAPCGSKRVAWSVPLALPEVKAISRALDCSVNDMLLTSVAGALRGYLEDKGDPTVGVEVRALVPLNLRPPGSEHELGNYFGIVAVELPVGIADPIHRLREVRRRMAELKQSYEAPVTFGLFAALGFAPKLAQDRLFDLLLSRATAVMTNVPGPQHALYLAGARLEEIMFWVPQSGDIGMGVSILSFGGNVQFGLVTDAAMVPDPEAIVARFNPEFEQLLYHVLMEPWGEDESEQPEPEPEIVAVKRPKRRTPPETPAIRKRAIKKATPEKAPTKEPATAKAATRKAAAKKTGAKQAPATPKAAKRPPPRSDGARARRTPA